MAAPNLALHFTLLLMVNTAHQTTLQQSSLDFQSADVGASVTLSCTRQDNLAVMFYWYRQTVGRAPKVMSTFYIHKKEGIFHDKFQNNPRFSLDTENSKYNLKISDLQTSDSATYYCVGSDLYVFKFHEGITLSVRGSRVTIPALVHLSSSEIIQPGGSVTLNCTVHTGSCGGEHSVYWFKNSEDKSHPGLIYTHGGRNDQCERKDDTQTHTCVYNLPMESLNLSHVETYYCAVASCGHILFGNGTKLSPEDTEDSPVLVYFLIAALSFTSFLVVFLAFSVYKMNKRNCQCTESSVTFPATSTANTATCEDAENLHYAALRRSKAKTPRRQRNNTDSECVYSSVKS